MYFNPLTRMLYSPHLQKFKKNTHTHTRPHNRTPLGRVVHKGYISRNLSAHNCTTSGFRAAFQFHGILRSTTYHLSNNIYRLAQIMYGTSHKFPIATEYVFECL